MRTANDPVDTAEIGKRLRARRQMLRMTLQEVADAFGTSRVNYNRYELGTVTVSAADLDKLAGILRVPTSYFFHDREVEKFEDSEAAEFYNGLPPTMKDNARTMLRALYEQAKAAETTHGRKAE